MSEEGRAFLSLWHGVIHRQRTMYEVAEEVCQAREVTLVELRGLSRVARIATARAEFMALAYAETKQSLPAIGRWLGGRHHTTILHGIRAHERRAAFA